MWVGGNGLLWSTDANWSTNAQPSNGDTVSFPANVVSTQDIPGLTLASVMVVGGDVILLTQQLTLNGSLATNQVFASGATNSFTGVGGISLIGSNPRFNIAAGSTFQVITNITGTGDVQKNGAGTLEFDKDAFYTGTTWVMDGILALNNGTTLNSALPDTQLRIGNSDGTSAEVRLLHDGQIPNFADVLIESDGKLNLNGFTESIGDLTLNTGTVTTANGNLTLNGNVSVTGMPAITQGNTGGLLALNAGNHTFDIPNAGDFLFITAQVTGGGGVTKTGAGSLNYQLIPAGSLNVYTGDTIVNEGTLTLHCGIAGGALGGKLVIGGSGTAATVRLSSDDELPTATPVTINDLGVLSLLTHNQTLTNVTMTGGASATTTTGILTLGGTVSTIAGGSATPATITGLVNVGTGATTFNVGNTLVGTDMIVNATLSGTGGLTKTGVGQLELLGPAGVPNTYTGQTWVRHGILDLNHGSSQVTSKNVLVGDGTGAGQSAVLFLGQLSEIPNDATVTVNTDGLFDLNGVNDAIGALVMAGGQVATGAGTLTVNGDVSAQAGTNSAITGHLSLGGATRTFTTSGNLTVDAIVSVGGITKAGTGILTLSGTNTYAGPTTMNAGSLIVNGTQAGSPVALAGGVLGGMGSVGSVTGTGGTVAPGISGVGTLTTKDLTLGGVTYTPELNAANAADQIKVVGAVNLAGSTLAPSLNYSPAVGTKFTVIDNDGADAVVGTFNSAAQGTTVLVGGRSFSISYAGGDGNDVVLTALAGLPKDFAVGPDSGGAPSVKVFNQDGSPKTTVAVFEPTFTGSVRTATADVNGVGVADLIVGSGPGRVAEVRVFDDTNGSQIRSVQPFADFTGGTFVAAGDFNNDGMADVIVTPDLSGGPRVTIISGADGSVMANFFGIDDANFRGGARAAAGDVNGDGTTDLVLSAGFGGGPRIAVFDGKSLGGTPTKLMNDYFAFEQTLRNGCYVTVGDIDGDGKADMIFGGGPRIYAISGVDGSLVANFFAGNVDNRGGVRVATKDLDSDARADLVVGDGSAVGSHVTTYLSKTVPANGTPPVEHSFDAFVGFLGGVFVG